MPTVGEAVAAWARLNCFRNKNGFLTICVSTLTKGDLERLPDVLAARLQLGVLANELYREIGKQICADNGVEWKEEDRWTGGINPDTPLSEEAAEKYRAFLDFIATH